MLEIPFLSLILVINLNQVFHVPYITKTLLTVSQFARYNKVFFEFHPNLCCIKYQLRRRHLSRELLRIAYICSQVSNLFMHQ